MNWVVGSIGPVAEDVVRILGPHAEREGFELHVQVEAGLPDVRFDRDALLQVVFNLLDNAFKYAQGATRRRIELDVHRSGADVSVTVRDHGPGVPPRQLGRVFEPFHRGESELTRTTKGTGLGLSVSFGIIKDHAGDISVDSEVGKGTDFTIELPMAAAYAVSQGLSPAGALRALTHDAAKILSIDDRVGSLAAGKDGDVLLLDGSPLDAGTSVLRAWVNGVEVPR